MARSRAWLRRVFRRPPPIAPGPAAPPMDAAMRGRSSSIGRDLDGIVAAAETAIARAESSARLADDHNAFAGALYALLRRRAGNLLFSPFSVRTLLAMICAGARGETATQAREALRISMPEPALHAAYADLIRSLTAPSGAAHGLAAANALFSQAGAPLAPAFADLIARQYGGALEQVDFRRGAAAARLMINQWVSDRTKSRIRDVLAPGQPAEDARLVVVNAVYFKAPWQVPFEEALTRHEAFFLQDGGVVQAPLMHQVVHAGYLSGPGYQVAAMPYAGGNLSFLVLVPDRRDGLAELESALTLPMLTACARDGALRAVELSLPRFKIEPDTVELRDSLAALGLRLAFTPQADFSGINGRVPPDEDALFLSAVVHRAFIDVNEEGTEAAATTVATWAATGWPAPPPRVPIVRADHPFLFAICDRRSGAIIFLGRVLDPTQTA